MDDGRPWRRITRRELLRGAAAAAVGFGALGAARGAPASSQEGIEDMNRGIVATRWEFPVIELAPLRAGSARTVEEMIAGLPQNNPEITSANFAACVRDQTGPAAAGLLLAKPLDDRQHQRVEDILRGLDEAGLIQADLPELALLKDHADELWAAGVYYVGALGSNSIWWKPEGGYAVYLILNPADRGFHLQWIGADTAGGTKDVREDFRGELNGQLWFLVRRKRAGEGGAAAAE